MTKLRSPIVWFGGKGKIVKKLLPLIPPHYTYVEVFGGGASLLFAKEPSPIEVYNDIDGDLVNLFRVIRDIDSFVKFWEKVALTPYSREEYNFCMKTYKEIDINKNPVERAYRFFVAVRQSFGGMVKKGWGYSVKSSRKKKSAFKSFGWFSIRELLLKVHLRIQGVQIENRDWRDILKAYDTPNTFFYLDPPYVPSTRKGGKYEYEMTEEDHKELVEYLLRLKGKWLLSGYPNDIYKKLEENGANKIEWKTACHAVGRTRFTKILGEGSATKKQPRIEAVWFNYDIKT